MAGRPKRRQNRFISAGAAPFVERGRELAVLRALLKTAKTGLGSLVLITGEPGMGKTRLVSHFAAQLGSPSVAVLWGRCHPDPDVPAYWPWKQVIARHAERRDDTALQQELGAAARDIVPLVPQLTVRFPEFARPQGQEPPEARQRVFEGFIDFLRNAACRQALLIVLDDLQWIDDASLSLLELSANECQKSALVLIAISRTTDFTNSRTEVRIGNLSRNGQHVALNGLDEAGVAKLIGAISGRAAPQTLSHTLYETTQGNPLFVEQLTRFVAAHDAWEHVDLGRLGLPHELKLAIRSRLARLSERARSTLASAAVVGNTSSIDILARVENLSIEELLRVLHDAITARVLQEIPGSPREFTFNHVLMRDALYDELPALDRAKIHRRVADAIVEVQGPDSSDDLSAVAHHYFQAARSGNPEPAVEYCTRAGDHALAVRAYEEAISHYRRALVALELGDKDQPRRGAILLQLGRAQRFAGEPEVSKQSFLEAIAVARATSDDKLLAAAALGFAGAWNAPLYLPDQRVLEFLRDASNRLRGKHPGLRARVIARRVHEHWWSLTREQARAELDEALELAEASRDANAIAHVHHVRHLALWNHEDIGERLSSAAKILSLQDLIEKELVLEGHAWSMADQLEAGNFAGFEAARHAHEELSRHLRLSDHIGTAQIRRASRDLLKGRVADAIAACNQPAMEATSGYHTLGWGFLRFCIHRELDSVHEVESLVRALAHAAGSWPAMRYWLVCTLAAAGSADARLEFEGISANAFSDVPDDLTRLVLLGLGAEACTLVGSAAQARMLYPYLVPFAGRHMQFGNAIAYFDSASHMLARLATQLEEWDSADEHFANALLEAQTLGAGPRTARIQFHWASMLLRTGLAGKVSGARSHLKESLAAARLFELPGLIAKIETQMKVLVKDDPASSIPDQRNSSPTPANSADPTPTIRAPTPTAAKNARFVFRYEGEYWALQFDHETIRLRNTRGLQLIATLLQSPGTLFHALELASGSESRALKRSSAGNILDTKARDAYRKRLYELTREQTEAEAQNDPPRAARARQERELLAQQLAAALGIGGRSRRAAAEAERARINVTRSIRSAISRMKARSPGLAHHLGTSIRTGTFCHYIPDPSRKIQWEL